MAAHTAPQLRTALTRGGGGVITALHGQHWVLKGRAGKRGQGRLAQAFIWVERADRQKRERGGGGGVSTRAEGTKESCWRSLGSGGKG